MQNQQRLETDVKLSIRQKIEYAVGDLGYNLIYFWVSSYLLIFYTDVFGISAFAVTTLMLVVRIFDGINDPVIGALADRTKQKTGTYKKWIQWGSFVLGVSTILLFWAHPSWPNALKLVYVYVTYIVVVCSSTATNMPYGVVMGTITTDSYERSKLSRLRFACVFLGNMGVIAAAPLVLQWFEKQSGSTQVSYFGSVALFCIIAVPLLWVTAFRCREVVKIPESQPKVTMKQRIRSFRSRPILIIIIAFLFHGFVYYGRAAIYPFYFLYFCGNASMSVQFGIVMGIANVVGTLIAPSIHKVLRHKGKAMVIEVLLFSVSTLLVYWFPPTTQFAAFYALSFLGGVGMGAYMAMLYSMTPDAIDYSYYESGVSASGFLYAFTSFMCKVGGALAPAIISVTNSALGYVPNAVQNAGVLSGINCMMSIVPGVVALIYALLMFAYPVSDDRYNEIKVELAKRQGVL
ncbi:MAG: glycoside-pentoside-hexuronide (GPH):cation symporter [Clostridia bacterium]|nr:glycoside-pentoside-hexuronide (GPH):cation symporter [Clostridia bacterium]